MLSFYPLCDENVSDLRFEKCKERESHTALNLVTLNKGLSWSSNIRIICICNNIGYMLPLPLAILLHKEEDSRFMAAKQ